MQPELLLEHDYLPKVKMVLMAYNNDGGWDGGGPGTRGDA